MANKENNNSRADLDDEESEHTNKIWHVTRTVLCTFLSLNFIVVLLYLRFSKWAQRSLLFLHFVRWPLSADYSKLATRFGIPGVRNFHVDTKDGIKLGVWHILPESLVEKAKLLEEETGQDQKEIYERLLTNGEPIIIYMHGNTGTRGTLHRMELYKLLQRMNFHVVTFDYRSYADSTYVLPDEVGVAEDGKTMVKWVYERKGNSQLYVWSHSLGTAICGRAMYELEQENEHFDGAILESPFTNLVDQIKAHPMTLFLRHMLFFDFFFTRPFVDYGITFKTDEYLAAIHVKTLILHAADDWVVPCSLGRKLYKYLVKNRSDAEKTVKYVEFSSANCYGHKYICYSCDLAKIIRNFTTGQMDAIPSTAV